MIIAEVPVQVISESRVVSVVIVVPHGGEATVARGATDRQTAHASVIIIVDRIFIVGSFLN
jgi:hypothetical protein